MLQFVRNNSILPYVDDTVSCLQYCCQCRTEKAHALKVVSNALKAIFKKSDMFWVYLFLAQPSLPRILQYNWRSPGYRTVWSTQTLKDNHSTQWISTTKKPLYYINQVSNIIVPDRMLNIISHNSVNLFLFCKKIFILILRATPFYCLKGRKRNSLATKPKGIRLKVAHSILKLQTEPLVLALNKTD